MSKYLFTPQDLALFFSVSDFTISYEKQTRDAIWEERNKILAPQYRNEKYRFIKEIERIRIQYEDDSFYSELQVINKVLEEIGSTYEISEDVVDDQYVEAFFRYVKLRLSYSEDVSYVKLKLRTLIKKFGYKRRTLALVDNIKRCLKALSLETYLRNYEKCDVNEINLDDMIMIRLK